MKNEKIIIGKIVNVVGLKGELKIYNYAEEKEIYEGLQTIYLERKTNSFEEKIIKGCRYKGEMVILKLEDVSDRNTAESLKDTMIYMDSKDLPPLPKGVYYIRNMIGMDVVNEKDEHIGVLDDVDCNRPQRLYIVKNHQGENILIPGVDEFIVNIDMKEKIIKVKLIEGML